MSDDRRGQGRWEIPDSWCWSTMGQIAEVIGGGTPSTSEPRNWNGDVPWITPADLSGYSAKTIAGGSRTITEQGLAGSGARLMPAGTVLMSSRAPVGYVAIAANALSTNQGFKSFVLRGNLLPDYVYWYLKGNRDLLNEFASGTTFPEVSGRRAAEIPIPIAPLAEQRRIVGAVEEHLSDLEAAVVNLDRARANVSRFKSAVLEQLFSDADSNGTMPLGQAVASTMIGLDRGRDQQNRDGYGVAYVKMNNVTNDGRVVFDDLVFVSVSPDEERRYALVDGDLLFNTRNSVELVGKTGLVRHPPSGAVYNNNLMRIRPGSHVLPGYLAWQMVAPPFRRKLGQIKRATTNVAAIYAKDLLPLQVQVPSMERQRTILEQVERQFAVSDRTTAEIDVQMTRAACLRQSILKRAFEGKLVPQNPSDEPAIELLARCRSAAQAAGAPQRSARGARKRPAARQERI